MRRNTLLLEELHQTIRPFQYLIEQNEWLNFEEMIQRIRTSESLSEPSVRAAVMALSVRDGIIHEKDGKIALRLICGGYVLEPVS